MTPYPALLDMVNDHNLYTDEALGKIVRNAIPELRSLLADVREREPWAWAARLQQDADWRFHKGAPNAEQLDYCRRTTREVVLLYTSPPSQQAVDAEAAADAVWVAIYDEGQKRRTLSPPQIEAIIAKHLVSPREGWVMVPREPTPDMLVEFLHKANTPGKAPTEWWQLDEQWRTRLQEAYKAMLSASPPLAQEGKS